VRGRIVTCSGVPLTDVAARVGITHQPDFIAPRLARTGLTLGRGRRGATLAIAPICSSLRALHKCR